MPFVTADFHFGHANIIKYTGRPFANTDEMDAAMIRNFNDAVTKEDTTYILGDVSMGSSGSARQRLVQLNGDIVLVLGNHDAKSLTITRSLTAAYGGIRMLMMHDPSFIEYVYEGVVCPHELHKYADVVLCGHVHEKWLYQWRKAGKNRIPVINVGVDRWQFKPVNLDVIVKLYKDIKVEGPPLVPQGGKR